MEYIRQVITEGLSIRAKAGIKVRQPLNSLKINGVPDFARDLDEQYLAILKEEMNVKDVELQTSSDEHLLTLDLEITPQLKREGVMRELIRQIQQARKQAGLEVDDRIDLAVETDDEDLVGVLADDELMSIVQAETLANTISSTAVDGYTAEWKLNDSVTRISLSASSS